MRVITGKRPLVKADIIAVEEVVCDLGRLLKRFTGIFGLTGDVNAPEDDLTFAGYVEEGAVFDRKAKHLDGRGRMMRGEKRRSVWPGETWVAYQRMRSSTEPGPSAHGTKGGDSTTGN